MKIECEECRTELEMEGDNVTPNRLRAYGWIARETHRSLINRKTKAAAIPSFLYYCSPCWLDVSLADIEQLLNWAESRR